MKDLIEKFGDQIPDAVKKCLDGNAEFTTLGLKYGVTNTTDPSTIEKKVIAYVTLHYLTVHKWLGDLNTEWSTGKYYQVGFDAAKDGHVILGSTLEQTESIQIEGLEAISFGEDNVLVGKRLSNLKSLRF